MLTAEELEYLLEVNCERDIIEENIWKDLVNSGSTKYSTE